MEHSGFPSDETLAAFIDGRVDTETRARVIEHLTSCGECYSVFVGATEMPGASATDRGLSSPLRRARLGMAIASLAAAAAIGFLVTPLGQRLYRQDGTEALARVAPATRTFDGRLSGFPFRPPARNSRGPRTDPALDPANWKLLGVASTVQKEADASPTIHHLHALGVSQLLLGRANDAVDKMSLALQKQTGTSDLRPAIKASRDAALLNDLSAALSTRASLSRSTDDASVAAFAAGRAWALERTPESAWNRAVALETGNGRNAAAPAWREYLAIDGTSEWALEARKHLQ